MERQPREHSDTSFTHENKLNRFNHCDSWRHNTVITQSLKRVQNAWFIFQEDILLDTDINNKQSKHLCLERKKERTPREWEKNKFTSRSFSTVYLYRRKRPQHHNSIYEPVPYSPPVFLELIFNLFISAYFANDLCIFFKLSNSLSKS